MNLFIFSNIFIMQKLLIFIALCLISLINAGSYSSNNPYSYPSSSCKRLENRIYLLTVTFPGLKPLYAAIRLLPNGAFDEIFSTAGGNNAAEVGVDFAMSHRFGTYTCVSKTVFRATGLGFLYKTAGVDFLKDNGATVFHDYEFRFSTNDKTLSGVVKFGVFPNGKNPFTTKDTPVFEGPIGQVKGELLPVRRFYDLST